MKAPQTTEREASSTISVRDGDTAGRLHPGLRRAVSQGHSPAGEPVQESILHKQTIGTARPDSPDHPQDARGRRVDGLAGTHAPARYPRGRGRVQGRRGSGRKVEKKLSREKPPARRRRKPPSARPAGVWINSETAPLQLPLHPAGQQAVMQAPIMLTSRNTIYFFRRSEHLTGISFFQWGG